MRQCIFIWIIIYGIFSPTYLFPQIDDITRLPVRSTAYILFESVPVALSETEVIIFYINPTQDTILSTISRDGGKNWDKPIAIIAVELGIAQSYFHLTAIRSASGRILVAWAIKNEGMLISSDDNGTSWSQPKLIMSIGIPAFQRKVENLNLSQLDDGKIVLGFDDNRERVIYYKHSSDDGVTWSDEVTELYSAQFPVNGLTVINSTPENLIAVFEFYPGSSSGIYKLISTDNGISWSDTISIVNTESDETKPKIVNRSDGSLLLTYLRLKPTQISDYNQHDIYYTVSSDGGETWQEEKRFTKYVGRDDFINISHLNGKTFISFASQRFTRNLQISYGILEETVEKYTPPYIYNYDFLYQHEEFLALTTYRVTVIDDGTVEKVEAGYAGSSTTENLYDDGMHDDLEPNDNVWGNAFIPKLVRNTDNFTTSVNKVILPFGNNGVLADIQAEITGPSFTIATDEKYHSITANTPTARRTFSSGLFEEGNFLFSGGFFLSGYNGNELWANGAASASLIEDYLPGVVGSEPEHPSNVIYTIDKNDPPFGYYWMKWKEAVNQGADFYDGDGDGIYNPVDKNWNGTWDPNEDMPALIGDVTAWCVYNDSKPASLRRLETEPQGIEIRQTLFASSLPDLENVLFIRYSILNTGSAAIVMDSVYFGIWEDADVGDFQDDVVGCDTLLNSGFYYNNTPDDVYGDNQPAFFTTILQGPIIYSNNLEDTAIVNYGELIGNDSFIASKNLGIYSHTFQLGGDPNLNDPDDVLDVKNYLEGKNRHSKYPDPCNFPYCEVRGNVNCNDINPRFWASGDPVTDIGWINRVNEDHRNLISTGQFKLEKDKPQEIIIAYLLGRGTDYFNSITVARENVKRVIQEYESNFTSMTYSPPTPTNPVTEYLLYHNYPNPFNPTTTIRYEIPQDGKVTIMVYDILGQEVRTILNEFKQADRYEVNFNAFGLASGVYIYSMKVNDFITSKKMILIR